MNLIPDELARLFDSDPIVHAALMPWVQNLESLSDGLVRALVAKCEVAEAMKNQLVKIVQESPTPIKIEWVPGRRVQPIEEVEREYGLTPGTLRNLRRPPLDDAGMKTNPAAAEFARIARGGQ